MRFRRITVIDDSPEVLEVLGDALRRDGIDVTLLGGRATLDEIAATDADVLIVDLRLGTDHLPGWELIRHVKAHPRMRDLPIVVCSGALDQMRAYGGAAVGPRTYLLPKPFSLDDLDAVLAEALGSDTDPSEVAAMPIQAFPDFATDPYTWFRRVGDEIGSASWGSTLARLTPSAWMSPEGHPWRVVRTPRGVEVRPDLVSPFLRYGNQPMVTALGLSEEIEVELTTSEQRWVGRFPCNTFDIAALGAAMLDERRLPHDNLPYLFPPKRSAPPASDTDLSVLHLGQRPTETLRA